MVLFLLAIFIIPEVTPMLAKNSRDRIVAIGRSLECLSPFGRLGE
jgi:hypothetical protein